MRNKITTEELIKNRFSEIEANQVIEEAKAEVEKILWGGRRENSGRKPKSGVVLKFVKRVSQKEAAFIDYARKHDINYDDLMQG